MSCVYSSLNFSTLEHDQENQLCEYMWTPLRTQYRVFFIFSLNFFLTALMGIHMNFHVAIKPQCCLGFNLLPHGMCPTREQMGLCTITHAKYKKSEGSADYPVDSTDERQSSCLTLFLSVHNPTRQTLGQIEHLDTSGGN